MSSLTVMCFIFGLLASFIGIYVIKTKHWVDISKHSLERIEDEGNVAIIRGVFFLILGIILILLGLVSLL
jgi:hypothetical protein